MPENAGNDEIGPAIFGSSEQRLDRRQILRVGPVGEPRDDAVPFKMRGQQEGRVCSALGRDEKAKTVTSRARFRNGIASWTARSASRPPFHAISALSPTAEA